MPRGVKKAAKKPAKKKVAKKKVAKPRLTGHALRNENLRKRSLKRSKTAPPLAAKTVDVRVNHLGMTRIELARQSSISRGALRDLELGVHTPTRNTLERFIEYCEGKNVPEAELEKLRVLYTGPADSLLNFIGRLELRAGSSPKLARKIGISPATLWEYLRRDFFDCGRSVRGTLRIRQLSHDFSAGIRGQRGLAETGLRDGRGPWRGVD